MLLLTLWAILLVIDADWWSKRNRMLVEQIEAKFPEAVKGVIPTTYSSLKPRGDSLYRASILMLLGIALVTYLKTASHFTEGGSFNSLGTIVVEAFVYLFFVFGIVYAIGKRETDLENYYITRKQLLTDLESTRALTDSEKEDRNKLRSYEREVRGKPNWRYYGLGAYLIVSAAFDFIVFQNVRQHIAWAVMGVLLQAIAGVAYGLNAYNYGKEDSSLEPQGEATTGVEHNQKGEPQISITIVSLFLAGWRFLTGSVWSNNLPTIGTGPRILDLSQKVDQLDSKLEIIRGKSEHLEETLEESLRQFVTRDEASKRFATKEDLERTVSKGTGNQSGKKPQR